MQCFVVDAIYFYFYVLNIVEQFMYQRNATYLKLLQ